MVVGARHTLRHAFGARRPADRNDVVCIDVRRALELVHAGRAGRVGSGTNARVPAASRGRARAPGPAVVCETCVLVPLNASTVSTARARVSLHSGSISPRRNCIGTGLTTTPSRAHARYTATYSTTFGSCVIARRRVAARIRERDHRCIDECGQRLPIETPRRGAVERRDWGGLLSQVAPARRRLKTRTDRRCAARTTHRSHDTRPRDAAESYASTLRGAPAHAAGGRIQPIVPPARDLAVAELHRAHVAVHDTVAEPCPLLLQPSIGSVSPLCAKVSIFHAVLGAAPVVVEKAAEALRAGHRLRAHVIVVLEVGRDHRQDRGTIAPLGQVLQLLPRARYS